MSRKIALVTDSTCDLPLHMAGEHGIHVIPQRIVWDNELYFDGIDLTSDAFYKRLALSETLPESAPPTPEEFAAEFETARAENRAEQIIAILLSTHLSQSFVNAQAAALMVDFPVFLHDSQTVSMGLGFAMLSAAGALRAGAGVDEIIEAARQSRRQTRILFTLDTLEFLYRGGRIGGARHMIGTALAIRPILALEHGQIEAVESVRTRARAVARMLELAAENTPPGSARIALMSGGADDEALALLDPARKQLRPQEIIECRISPSIGVHTGPGVLGITVRDG
ncbi:MAG: DegV family protein [Chloroflexota bacterium]